MLRSIVLLVALGALGCGKKPKDTGPAPRPPVQPPPPQDSGADKAPGSIRLGEENGEGRGYPNRLLAQWWRVVRDDVTVSVLASDSADPAHLSLMVVVRNRNKDKPLQLTGWSKPQQITLKDEKGKRYPLIPIPDDIEQAMRKADVPKDGAAYGPGPVTPELKRFILLKFDRSTLAAEYLDLDLDGAPVGFADPILFRVSREMMTQPKKP